MDASMPRGMTTAVPVSGTADAVIVTSKSDVPLTVKVKLSLAFPPSFVVAVIVPLIAEPLVAKSAGKVIVKSLKSETDVSVMLSGPAGTGVVVPPMV